jgi:hypothetical protein
MWYKVDFKRLVIILLPTFLRKPVVVGYVHALLMPIDNLHYKWTKFRDDNIYKLSHNGQVCYLRGALNDSFDPVLRRIYIGNSNLYATTYIFTEGEAQDVWLETEGEEDTIWLRTESETADTGLDFIVWVPQSVFNNQYHELNAMIHFYKAGGKKYSIYIINE